MIAYSRTLSIPQLALHARNTTSTGKTYPGYTYALIYRSNSITPGFRLFEFVVDDASPTTIITPLLATRIIQTITFLYTHRSSN